MFVTVNELMGLPGLPGTLQGLRFTLKKRVAGSPEMMRRRHGTKAFEYHINCLPDVAREAVQVRMARQVLAQSAGVEVPEVRSNTVKAGAGSQPSKELIGLYRNCPALMDNRLRELTDDQKKIADARMTLVREVLRLMQEPGNGGLSMNRKQAVTHVALESRAGTLPQHVQQRMSQMPVKGLHARAWASVACSAGFQITIWLKRLARSWPYWHPVRSDQKKLSSIRGWAASCSTGAIPISPA